MMADMSREGWEIMGVVWAVMRGWTGCWNGEWNGGGGRIDDSRGMMCEGEYPGGIIREMFSTTDYVTCITEVVANLFSLRGASCRVQFGVIVIV